MEDESSVTAISIDALLKAEGLMNKEGRQYIQESLQPWRLPENIRSALGEDSTSPIQRQFSPIVRKYFNRRFGANPCGPEHEGLFELELIAIYNTIVSSLPDRLVSHFREKVAFGACFSGEPATYVTRHQSSYLILWDFRLDDLVSKPTALVSAGHQSLIDDTIAMQLFSMCIAKFAFDAGEYADPLACAIMDRQWTNHMAWGISMFSIAHEISHIALGHLENAEILPVKIFNTDGSEVALGAFNKSEKQEIQADAMAVNILVNGIKAGRFKGYSFNEHQSPFNALYQHMTWLFHILECVEIIRLALNLVSDKGRKTHPHPRARRRLALGCLLGLCGRELTNNKVADANSQAYLHAMINILTTFGLPLLRDEKTLLDMHPDFYRQHEYSVWLRNRGFGA